MENEVIIGIHPDQIGKESYSDKWTEFLRARGADVRMLDLLATDALEQARQCDGVMWRWAHNPQDKQSAQRILYTIEHYLGIPVYPDSRTAWHYDEKMFQFYLLQALQAPVPQTWLFWDKDHALEWARTTPYPVVFKLSTGAGSSNVLKVENEEEAIALIKRAFERGIFPYTMNEFKKASFFPRTKAQMRDILHRLKDSINYVWHADYPRLHPTWWKPEYGYAYFQEFLPINEFDTRISVIGDRTFGYRRMNRPNDFRASGSGNFDVNPDSIDKKCIEIAFQISKQGKFQSMAYDFLVKNGEPVICEISYAFVDWMIFECPGHWESNLNWISGNMWPEEAQIQDFMNLLKARFG